MWSLLLNTEIAYKNKNGECYTEIQAAKLEALQVYPSSIPVVSQESAPGVLDHGTALRLKNAVSLP